MERLAHRVACVLVCLLFTCLLFAQSPKREMRATWLTTVLNTDWPSDSITDIKKQQRELCEILDSVASLNFNAVFFQIRPACDAFYHSAYEPWSSWLNKGRGVNPGYDPLEFCIEECHKRGLSCHGWINPYRYALQQGWKHRDDLRNDYARTHPDWLLKYKTCTILDPGNPAVQRQIKKIVGDIINHYRVDGIILDDYFYSYDGTTTQDAKSVQRYKPAGITIHDWRRNNVNTMIKSLYDTIQAVCPWVVFGVAPFGIWTMNDRVAQNEGLTLPANVNGADMYKQIYCDPIAWIKGGYVDYISPQLYWGIGSEQDYETLCRWWGKVCEPYNLRMYPSMAVYRYNSGLYSINELPNEALLNRQAVPKNQAGSVLFNTKGWIFDNSLREKFSYVFPYPALCPAINWKPATLMPMVENIIIRDNTIFWDFNGNFNEVHFALYAIPNEDFYSANETNSVHKLFNQAKFLLGIAYENYFELPDHISYNSHKFAVSVLDKYNNEYSFRVFNTADAKLKKTKLLSPKNHSKEGFPIEFSWRSGAKAVMFQFQVATDEAFEHIVFSTETPQDFLYSKDYVGLEKLQSGVYFWRVRTSSLNRNDQWTMAHKIQIE